MKNVGVVRHCLAVLVLVTVVVAGCASTRQVGAAEASPAAGANPASPAAGANPAAPGAVTSPTTAVSSGLFSSTRYTSQGHTHLNPNEPDDFVYNSNPPSSGPHRELFTDTLISRKALPSYIQVHLLEHGNVLLQYSCTCPDVAASLAQIAIEYNKLVLPRGDSQPTAAEVNNAEDQGKAVIVAPYPHMKARIALSAWTHVGTLPTINNQKIKSFISVHLGNPTE